jgi:hypothetical protein
MKTKTEKVSERSIAIRLPQTVLDRVDEHAIRMQSLAPGLSFSRADALRSLLVSALDAAEAK